MLCSCSTLAAHVVHAHAHASRALALRGHATRAARDLPDFPQGVSRVLLFVDLVMVLVVGRPLFVVRMIF